MKSLALKTLGAVAMLLLALLDISLNVLFNGRKETISCRAGRAAASGKLWGKLLCTCLNEIDPGHCDRAVNNPLGGLKE